jgi:hypothetical protein
MKRSYLLQVSIVLTIFALLLVTDASAQPANYNLAWDTLAGGGTSRNGTYTLAAAIGQFEASAAMRGGVYCMAGGVWGDPLGKPCFPSFYLPLIVR